MKISAHRPVEAIAPDLVFSAVGSPTPTLLRGGSLHRDIGRNLRSWIALRPAAAVAEPLRRLARYRRDIVADRPDFRGGPTEAIRQPFVLRLQDVEHAAGVTHFLHGSGGCL